MSESHHVDRRAFLAGVAGAGLAGSVTVLRASAAADRAAPRVRAAAPRITFSVIGLNHAHINGMTDAVARGGGELVAVYAKEPDLAAAFVKKYPQVKLAGSEKEILESNVQLVLSAAIPDERAPLGVRDRGRRPDVRVER